ncbi:MAG: 2-phospho-L-lactate guanylyltransferase [Acidimicrobiales bacterium]
MCPDSLPHLDGCAVLVPVKAFRLAKERLAPTMAPHARAELARRMATRVIRAAAPLPVAVVCDDDEVATWAEGMGAAVIAEPGRGLNGAVEEGVRRLRDAGAAEVLVAHGDLPFAEALASLAGFGGVTLVPDRRDDGTNVICIPAGAGFRFAYGSGSFGRHCLEVGRLGLALRVLRPHSLVLDVDEPMDVAAAGAWDAER